MQQQHVSLHLVCMQISVFNELNDENEVINSNSSLYMSIYQQHIQLHHCKIILNSFSVIIWSSFLVCYLQVLLESFDLLKIIIISMLQPLLFAVVRSTIDRLPSAQGLILIYEREQAYECRLRKSMSQHDCHHHGELRPSREDARPAVKMLWSVQFISCAR